MSVVVPTHGRPLALARCLEALAAQDHPPDRFEVIVVNDQGDPPAADVVQRLGDRLDVRLIVQPHAGPARARNRGVAAAAGALIAFTDDDCRPAPDWVGRMAAALERRPGAMVGGRIINELAGNRYAAASQLITDIVYSHYNAQPERAGFCASNNLGVARAPFEEIGGFDERFAVVACEDRDLCDRWTHSGRVLAYVPEALVRHAHAMGAAGYVRQHFTYGRGAVHYHRLRGARGSGRMRDEMGFHVRARHWLRRAMRGRRPGDAAATAALLLVWQAANLGGFLYESAARTGYRRSGPGRPDGGPGRTI